MYPESTRLITEIEATAWGTTKTVLPETYIQWSIALVMLGISVHIFG